MDTSGHSLASGTQMLHLLRNQSCWSLIQPVIVGIPNEAAVFCVPSHFFHTHGSLRRIGMHQAGVQSLRVIFVLAAWSPRVGPGRTARCRCNPSKWPYK